MLAPIRLGNATASLQLRCQPRRKEKHPHPASPSAPSPLRGEGAEGEAAPTRVCERTGRKSVSAVIDETLGLFSRISGSEPGYNI